MIKTVNDLILALQKFHPNTPVCIRYGFPDGVYSDWMLHIPEELYPGSKVCLSAFQHFEDVESAKVGES